jgi:hypothetical protein
MRSSTSPTIRCACAAVRFSPSARSSIRTRNMVRESPGVSASITIRSIIARPDAISLPHEAAGPKLQKSFRSKVLKAPDGSLIARTTSSSGRRNREAAHSIARSNACVSLSASTVLAATLSAPRETCTTYSKILSLLLRQPSMDHGASPALGSPRAAPLPEPVARVSGLLLHMKHSELSWRSPLAITWAAGMRLAVTASGFELLPLAPGSLQLARLWRSPDQELSGRCMDLAVSALS